jgi:IS5 family transposase
MKPKAPVRQAQCELFRVELDRLVDPAHALVKLGRQINWAGFDELLGQTYAATNGAPGVSTRLLVALHYLKYQHDLSDEAVVGSGLRTRTGSTSAESNFSGMKGRSIPRA